AADNSRLAPSGGNTMCTFGAIASPAASRGAKRCSGGGSLAVLAISTPLGAGGGGSNFWPGRAKASEQVGAAGATPAQPRDRCPIGAPGPPSDGKLAVEAHSPGVAIAVARPGLEGDAAACGVFRRRHSDQHARYIPGGNRLNQTFRRRRGRAKTLDERRNRPLPRKSCIKHGEIGESHAHAAKAERKPWRHLTLGQHEGRASLSQPRDEPGWADLLQHGHRRNVERLLQRAAPRDRALDVHV